MFDHLQGLDLHGGESGQAAAQSGAQQRAAVTRQRQPLEQAGGEVAQQERADDVDDERRPRPACRVGYGEACASAARAQRAQRAAGEDRRQFAVVMAGHGLILPSLTTERLRSQERAQRRTGRIGDHGGQPPRRSAGAARRPRRSAPPRHGVLHGRTRSRRRRPAGGVRHLGSSRLERWTGRSTRRTSWPPPRRSSSTAPRRAPPARCSSAATPMGCPSRPGCRRWRCWPPMTLWPMIDSADRYTPTPAVSHAILTYNRGPHARVWPTASSSRRRTTRRATAGSSTTRPTAGRPTPTPPG